MVYIPKLLYGIFFVIIVVNKNSRNVAVQIVSPLCVCGVGEAADILSHTRSTHISYSVVYSLTYLGFHTHSTTATVTDKII